MEDKLTREWRILVKNSIRNQTKNWGNMMVGVRIKVKLKERLKEEISMKKVLNFFVKKHDLASITALMQNLKYNRNL